MITRILTTFAFGWEKFYAQNCVPGKLSSRITNPLAFGKLSKISAVNRWKIFGIEKEHDVFLATKLLQ
ncbi:MAG: hypothetical protein LBQ23_01495 [Puniceicoccales bacterium]|nr:hypothetical protein [Puniceicoccales bacterium]